jgi:hypothetical protein
MVSREKVRAIAIGAVTVSLMVLGACSEIRTSNHMSPQAQKEASKKDAAAKAQQIAKLSDQKKQQLKLSDDAKKKLPVLLAQSDSALRLVEQYKNMAAKEKNPMRKSQLTERANKAQVIADQKSAELIDAHKSIYETLGQVRDIDSKIAALTAEKKRAEQVAMGTGSGAKL